jgi:hypothetical protein
MSKLPRAGLALLAACLTGVTPALAVSRRAVGERPQLKNLTCRVRAAAATARC